MAKSLSKGEKLNILMDCSERLNNRLDIAFADYRRDSSAQIREQHWKKVQAIYKASTRISKKISDLITGG